MNPASITNISAQSSSAENSLSVAAAGASATTSRNLQPSSNPAIGGAGAASSAAVPAAAEQPKKSTLGAIHMATPKVAPHRNTQNGGEADAGIPLTNEEPQPNTEALNAGPVGGNKQPSAPPASLPLGGGCRPRKTLFFLPPPHTTLPTKHHI